MIASLSRHMVAAGFLLGMGTLTAVAAPQIGGVTLNVTDLDKTLKFYTTIIGMKMTANPAVMGSMKLPPVSDHVVNFSGSNSDTFLTFHTEKNQSLVPKGTPGAPYVHGDAFDHVMLKVPDVAAIVKRAKDAGYPAQLLGGMREGRGLLKDPDGYNIELIQQP